MLDRGGRSFYTKIPKGKENGPCEFCFRLRETKGAGGQGKRFFDKFYWKYAILFNLPLIPHYLSQTVLSRSDRIMIERMVGADQAGIYSVAYSISLVMVLFNIALGQTISPWMFKKIKNRQISDIAPVAYGSMAFIAVMNIILIAIAPEVVSFFAPPAYHEAIWVIPPVAMSSYFMFMYDYFSRFEFYFEKTKGIMFASIFGAALNVLLNYICIQWWGYIAAAYTTLICYIVYVICHYILMKKACEENNVQEKVYDNKILIGLSLIFMVVGFAVMFTYYCTPARYGLIILIIAAAIWQRKRLMKLGQSFMKLRKNEES